MEDVINSRRGFLGFWTTLPGVLTAAAAVITALTGAFVLFHDNGRDGATGPPGTPNIIVVPGPAPVVPQDVSPAVLDLSALRTGPASPTAQVEDAIDGCLAGDDLACASIIDSLVAECDAGYGISCDMLYEVSPFDSDYETFGATCGARFDLSFVDRCRELDGSGS